MINYNPIYDKLPVGGVSVHEPISMYIGISDISVTGVRLIVRNTLNNNQTTYIGSLILNVNNRESISSEIHHCNDIKAYEIAFTMDDIGIYKYRFELDLVNGDIAFCGQGQQLFALRQDFLPEYQLTVYDTVYPTPSHLQGGLIYHIFVDRYNRVGNISFNKHGVLKDWCEPVTTIDDDGVYRANDFYGGNLQGIIDKLEYLDSLGVTSIYLSPIFEASSTHRYDTGNYHKIDELIGDEDIFNQLVANAKAKGMSIILDGVFNHTGADSVYFNKFGYYDNVGAYQSKESLYNKMYDFSTYPDEYNCWWGVTVCPTTNKYSVEYSELMFGKQGILNYWTRDNINWRLDVVDELPVFIMDKLAQVVKCANSQSIIIGEVWEDASIKTAYNEYKPYFFGSQLDGVMNYPFKTAIIDYVKGGKSTQFIEEIYTIVDHYPKFNLDNCMTLIGSHDTDRIINVLSGEDYSAVTRQNQASYYMQENNLATAIALKKIAVTLQYMLSGVPTIYYGDEINMQGIGDPANRRPMQWNNVDSDMLEFYQKLGKIRKDYKQCFYGSMKIDIIQGDILRISRSDGSDEVITYINRSDEGCYVEVECVYDLINARKIENNMIFVKDILIVVK